MVAADDTQVVTRTLSCLHLDSVVLLLVDFLRVHIILLELVTLLRIIKHTLPKTIALRSLSLAT